jgi:hypothetical protein
MENFNKFILEIQTLHITTDEDGYLFLKEFDLEHYEPEISRLKELALTDFSSLPLLPFERELKRVKGVEQMLIQAQEKNYEYKKLFKNRKPGETKNNKRRASNDELYFLNLKRNVFSRFIIPKVEHYGKPGVYFDYFLDTVIQAKKSKLTGFILQIEEMAESQKDAPGENKLFTTARQVLAVYFLLKNCSINPVDKPREVTKFIQFLTGKELSAKRLQDTYIYKKVCAPFKLNEKEALKDLRFILPFFTELGIRGIEVEIENEIMKSRDIINNSSKK